MALAVNRLQDNDGGWVLVHKGEVTGETRLEVGGLMAARTAEALDAEMQAFAQDVLTSIRQAKRGEERQKKR